VSKAITTEHLEWYSRPNLTDELIAAAVSSRNKALLGVLGKGGLRITEAVRIRIPDVDFERESLSILGLKEHTRIRCHYCGETMARKHLFCPACGNKVAEALRDKIEQRTQRIIPIDRGTLDSIEQYLECRRQFSYRGELLFPLTRQRVWQIVEKLGRRIKLRGLHPESLRNLLAARWVNKGLDIEKLRFLMGYADTARHPPVFTFEQIKSEYRKLWETEPDGR
jgi:integrase/recombinase XerD